MKLGAAATIIPPAPESGVREVNLYEREHSTHEIAEELGVTRQAVDRILLKAVATLKQRLELLEAQPERAKFLLAVWENARDKRTRREARTLTKHETLLDEQIGFDWEE